MEQAPLVGNVPVPSGAVRPSRTGGWDFCPAETLATGK